MSVMLKKGEQDKNIHLNHSEHNKHLENNLIQKDDRRVSSLSPIYVKNSKKKQCFKATWECEIHFTRKYHIATIS